MSIRLLSLVFGTLPTKAEASAPERVDASSVSALLSNALDAFRTDEELARQPAGGKP